MRHLIHISLISILLVSGANLFAAPKDKPKNDRPATEPLPKVPARTDSAVQLTGSETPEHIARVYTEAINGLLAGLAGNDAKALVTLEGICHSAGRPGAESERLACCNAIVAVLSDVNTGSRVKSHLLHQLQLIGLAESVPALVKLLGDADVHVASDARLALINNPACPEQYRAKFATEALAIDRQDPVIAGDREIQRAYASLRGGKTSEAAAIFATLAKPSQPRQIRFAALRGTLTIEGDAAAPKILELIAGNDADGRTVALGQIKLLGAGGRQTVVNGLAKLPVPMQPVVIEALANLDEKAVLPMALNFIKSPDADLRRASLAALTRLGDASNVPLIVHALGQAAPGADRAPFEQALMQLPGSAADAAITDAMKAATGETQGSLIGVLAKRGSHSAVPALLTVTDVADVANAKAAYRALGDLALPTDATVLIQKLVAAKNDVRGDAENATAKALLKVEPVSGRVEIIQGQLKRADDKEARCALLRLFRTCPDPKALATVQTALRDDDATVRETALRTLADWSDLSAWDTLFAIYREPEKPAYGVLALRGLVKLAQDANASPKPALIERYRQLLEGARSDDDRKRILGALGGCGDIRAAEVALSQLSVAGVRAEAELAVKKIAGLIKKKHPEDARKVLQQLKATTR